MWPLPEVGTIVWCRFPEWPHSFPGPKPRPAMVMDVSEKSNVVKVAYGTSQHLDHLYAGEFAIRQDANPIAFIVAGLTLDTKFNLNQSMELIWNDAYFENAPHALYGANPKMGILHDSMLHACKSAFLATCN